MDTEAILQSIETKMEEDPKFEALIQPFFEAGFAEDSFGEFRSDVGDNWAIASGKWVEIGSYSHGRVKRVRI